MADFDPVSYMMGQKASPRGGSSTLSGLTDVDISDPTDGQTLVYNAESGKWVNGAGGGVLMVTMDDQTGALDHTTQEVIDAAMRGVVVCPSTDDLGHDEHEITFYRLAFVSYVEDTTWQLVFMSGNATISFNATHADDYPVPVAEV